MNYLSNFPPCFLHSRQNRENYTSGEDPTAEQTVSSSDWTSVTRELFHWPRCDVEGRPEKKRHGLLPGRLMQSQSFIYIIRWGLLPLMQSMNE